MRLLLYSLGLAAIIFGMLLAKLVQKLVLPIAFVVGMLVASADAGQAFRWYQPRSTFVWSSGRLPVSVSRDVPPAPVRKPVALETQPRRVYYRVVPRRSRVITRPSIKTVQPRTVPQQQYIVPQNWQSSKTLGTSSTANCPSGFT